VTVTRVLLVRHGQSTWNADSRWQGQADPPLSELGERQARAASGAVAALGTDAIVTSDLIRAASTASLAAPSGVVVTTAPAFRERDAGEWTGLTRAQIEASYPGDLEARRPPRGFEPDEPLLARVLPALRSLGGAGTGVIVVVTHGGVIGTVERRLGVAWEPVPNLAGRWIEVGDGGQLTLGARELLIDPDAVTLTVPDQI
jgi:broad specificity phosphatase PhoE